MYYRTTPKLNSGDWFSLNGNLAIQELLSVSYDTSKNVVIGGAQDNAAFMTDPSGGIGAITSGNLTGRGFSGGDGGLQHARMSYIFCVCLIALSHCLVVIISVS